MLSKLLRFVKKNSEDIILFIGVALISLLSFMTGYIMSETQKKEPMQFEAGADEPRASEKNIEPNNNF